MSCRGIRPQPWPTGPLGTGLSGMQMLRGEADGLCMAAAAAQPLADRRV